jgi:hypothetical protein
VPLHDLDNRGVEAGANPGVGYGRFGKMFDLRPAMRLPRAALEAIATAMIKEVLGRPITETESALESPTIPAGYTYFGQFVAHDITFDPTPLTDSSIDVAALEDFRTPALDLDSVYGSGPDDQPYLYSRSKLRVGERPGNGGAKFGTKFDLNRLPGPPADDRIALIGDRRNDENKIVAQIHAALMAFHNKVIDDDNLLRKVTTSNVSMETVRFRAAASIVRWHYQWVVVHDYLDRLLEPYLLEEVLNRPGHMPRLPNYLKAAARYAYVPVEFSGAAFRLGHSMIRPSYALNCEIGTEPNDDPNKPSRIPTFSGDPDPAKSLNGFPGTLPPNWGIDWGYFLDDLSPRVVAGPDERQRFRVPQSSYRIGAALVSPLANLPRFRGLADSFVRNLAFRNLARGLMLGLPSGEAVANALGIHPMPPDIVWSVGSRLATKRPPPDADAKEEMKQTNENRGKVRKEWVDGGGPLQGSTPLWYYILREAEYFGVTRKPDDPCIAFGGQHLGPVGSRIVAETLIGLLWHDRGSFLHRSRDFVPFPEITGGAEKFTLDRLMAYALS